MNPSVRGFRTSECGWSGTEQSGHSYCAVRAPRGGFTIIEMLMAAAITVVMVIFLHVVFQAVSNAVSLGTATSDIIRANVDSTVQLSNDGEAMLGPTGNGFLVILQKQITGVKLRPEDPANSIVRSDQVAWVRTLGDQSPPSPATPGSYDSYANATTTATHARVWYGHVLRTDPNGATATDLGLPGANEFAVQWVLGRQLLFFDPAPTVAVHINSAGAYPTWTVTGYSDPDAPDDSWHKGLSDIFDADYDTIRNYIDDNNPLTLTDPGYPAGAYQFTYGSQRLWCNPRPPEGVDVPAWRVAQVHPYYIGNVSDFRVEFAGEYSGPLGISVSLINGQIKWYSHFYNNQEDIPNRWDGGVFDPNEPTTFKPPVVPAVPGGLVTILPSLTKSGIYDINPLPNADAGFTFQPGGTGWPTFLRLRYRVHDPRGQLADRDAAPGKIFERIVQVAP